LKDVPPILYFAPRIPKLSETFVSREIFALRKAGMTVFAACAHEPERGLGDDALDALADEAHALYRRGPWSVLAAALAEGGAHPIRSAITIALAVRDAARGGDVRGAARIKVLWHGVAGLALARHARRIGAGHLHAHFAHVSATIAMYAARQLAAPFSFTGHAADLFRDRVLLREKLERASFVACISRWHREFYRTIAPRPDEAYPVVRCGVDPAEFAGAASASEPAASSGPVRIVAVGRLIPKKGFDLLLDALASLRDAGHSVHCRLAGDGPERGALEEQVRRLALADCVELDGAVPNRAVRALLREADLFALPCRVADSGDRDGIPVVLMEAMMSGVCAVSGDLPAIRELIEDRRSGRLTPPGDAAALAACLRELCAHPDERRRLAEGGRRAVLDEFALDENAGRLIQALQGVFRG
jgi:colanic acid/amylovoran biosynthesis glycosyltransferase